MASQKLSLRVAKPLLLAAGWVSLALGIMGIFLPLLPTTPFILLAAACFLRSSDKTYQWLVSHPRWGIYIEGYLQQKGIPLKAKIVAMITMWGSLLFTAFVLTRSPVVQVILPLIGAGVSVYILRQPTWNPADDAMADSNY